MGDDEDGDGIEIDWLRCPECGKKYPTEQQLQAHQAAHSSHFEE